MLQLDQLGIDRAQYEIRYNDKVDDTSDPNTLEVYSDNTPKLCFGGQSGKFENEEFSIC